LRKELLILLLYLLALSPDTIRLTLKYFLINFSPFLFYYKIAFSIGLFVILIFLLKAIYKKYFNTFAYIVKANTRSPIKGLLHFQTEDDDVFKHLQRNDMLNKCLLFITNPSYRLGVLVGESGVGKTSFIQASLIPFISQEHTSFYCVSIRFSNEFVLNSIRAAFMNQLGLTEEETSNKDFIAILDKAREKIDGKTLILIFDQFEQFFVHRKTKEKRKPFLDIMSNWYKNYTDYPMKILISIRSDMMGYLHEIQSDLNFPLSANQNYFYLDKLTSEQSFQILQVISDKENLPFDKDFMKEITERELPGREDGLISPVDLQIFSLMLRDYRQIEGREFTRTDYEKLGGVEDLLVRFLRNQLITHRYINKVALKILILLTDFERNIRSGMKSVKFIQNKLKLSAGNRSIQTTLDRLERLGLISIVSNTPDSKAYQLAHESMIAPLRKLAGTFIYNMERTNLLLEERTNQWMGNNFANKFLFSFREYIRIKRFYPFLTWGTNKEYKENLLLETEKKIVKNFSISFIAVLLFLSPLFLWLAPIGQQWQLKKDLYTQAKKIESSEILKQSILSLLLSEKIEDAESLFLSIKNFQLRSVVANEVYYILKKLDRSESVLYLQYAIDSTEKIEKDYDKISNLLLIYKNLVSLNEKERSNPMYQSIYLQIQSVTNHELRSRLLLDLLNSLLVTDLDDILEILSQTEVSISSIKDIELKNARLLEIIKHYHNVGHNTKVNELLKQFNKQLKFTNNPYYRSTALASYSLLVLEIGLNSQNLYLVKESLVRAKEIPLPSDKSLALKELSLKIIQALVLSEEKQLIDMRNQFILSIPSDSEKVEILLELSKKYKILGDEKNSLLTIQKAESVIGNISSPEIQSGLYRELSTYYYKNFNKEKANSLLEKSIKATNRISNGYEKSVELQEIAKLALELGNKDKANQMIELAISKISNIREDSYKSTALSDIARITMLLENEKKSLDLLKISYEIANIIQYEAYRSSSLRYVVSVSTEFAEKYNHKDFLELAQYITRDIRTDSEKSRALRDLSILYRKLKEYKESDSLLAESVESALEIPDDLSRDGVLKTIALLHAENGNWFKARRIVNRILDDQARVETISLFFLSELEKNFPNLTLLLNKEE